MPNPVPEGSLRNEIPTTPTSLGEALWRLVSHPYELLVRRWNWKSALLSALLRGGIYFFVNLKVGLAAASAAMLTEWSYRVLTARRACLGHAVASAGQAGLAGRRGSRGANPAREPQSGISRSLAARHRGAQRQHSGLHLLHRGVVLLPVLHHAPRRFDRRTGQRLFDERPRPTARHGSRHPRHPFPDADPRAVRSGFSSCCRCRAASDAAPPRLPNVLFITIDTLRADHLSCYGYHLKTSPNIDRLAEQGVRYEHAYTVTSRTGPSHYSMFTSRYPQEHGAKLNGFAVAENTKFLFLPQILRRFGYKAGAFVSAWPLTAHLTQLDRWFDTYDEELNRTYQYINSSRWAEDVTPKAISWLEAHDQRSILSLGALFRSALALRPARGIRGERAERQPRPLGAPRRPGARRTHPNLRFRSPIHRPSPPEAFRRSRQAATDRLHAGRFHVGPRRVAWANTDFEGTAANRSRTSSTCR